MKGTFTISPLHFFIIIQVLFFAGMRKRQAKRSLVGFSAGLPLVGRGWSDFPNLYPKYYGGQHGMVGDAWGLGGGKTVGTGTWRGQHGIWGRFWCIMV